MGEGGRARRPLARGGGGGRGAEGGPKAAQGWGDGDAKAGGGTVGDTGGLGPREEEGVQMRPRNARPAAASEAQGVRPSPRSALPGAPSWLAPAPPGTRGGASRPLAPGAARGPALTFTCGRAGGGAGETCTGRGCRGTGRPQGSARSHTPLCDSGSATAPPETSRPRPIRARLLTSMRLALARAVALATLKGQTPEFLLPPHP